MTYWQDKINDITSEFIDGLADLPQPTLAVAPLGKWSIAQHIKHIIKVNESYFPAFDNILAGKHSPPALSWVKPWVNLCGTIVYRAVKPSTQKKIKTFPLWEPGETVFTDQLWEMFKLHQTRLIEYYTQLAPLPANKIVIASPANPKIIYNLENALCIIAAHELRHLNQALELKKQLISR